MNKNLRMSGFFFTFSYITLLLNLHYALSNKRCNFKFISTKMPCYVPLISQAPVLVLVFRWCLLGEG